MWRPGKDALGDMDPRLEHATWIEREPQPPEPIPPELERDALRAENEMLRRALAILSTQYELFMGDNCPVPVGDDELEGGESPCNAVNDDCAKCTVQWAISEAGKE